MHDVRHAVRALRFSPIVSTVAVLSLAIGIGATTAIFSVVNSLLLRPLPVADPERLATISSGFALNHGFTAGLGWNYPMWLQLHERAGMFDGVLAWSGAEFNLAQGGEKQPASGLFVSGDYFTVLGVPARIGRVFTTANDGRGGGPERPVAVISDRFWERRFGRDHDVIGSPLVIDAVPFTIVGVTPPDFFGTEVGRHFDVALPLGTEPLVRPGRSALDRRGSFFLTVMLRLKSDQSIEGATATLHSVHADLLGVAPEQLARVSPAFVREPFILVPAATGTADQSALRNEYAQPLVTLFAVVGLVLLVACVNIANLLIARATTRRHELSVRLALGAPPWRLARQQFVESLQLASLGALVGLVLATWGAAALAAYLANSRKSVFLEMSLDWRVLAFTSALAAATALLSGAVPAFRVTRVAPGDALRRQGRGTREGGRPNLLGALVIAQFAVSQVIVVTTGLLVQTFDRLTHQPMGFDSGRVLVVSVDISRAALPLAERHAFVYRLIEAVSSVPGVERAAASRLTPLSDASNSAIFAQPGKLLENAVTPGWFATYGTATLGGRDFDRTDAAGAPVALVNSAYVRTFLPGRSAIGETVEKRMIVGVVEDAVFGSVRKGMKPTMYVPWSLSAEKNGPGASTLNISVRSAGATPMSLARSIGAALTAIDPDVTFTFQPLQTSVDASVARERLIAMLSGVFGLLGLSLAGLGLYGVTSYAVNSHRREIGIRLALGATPAQVVRGVLAQASFLVGAGVVAGIVASLWLSTAVAALLYGLEPHDPITVAGAAIVLSAVGVASAWVPAHRASAIDPAQVLRND